MSGETRARDERYLQSPSQLRNCEVRYFLTTQRELPDRKLKKKAID